MILRRPIRPSRHERKRDREYSGDADERDVRPHRGGQSRDVAESPEEGRCGTA